MVTQWDKKPETNKLTVEEYIKNNRSTLHKLQESKNAKIFYRDYSIGKVRNTYERDEKTGEEKPSVLITNINRQYPYIFWNKLYLLSTGRSLEPGGCLAKLFGFSQ